MSCTGIDRDCECPVCEATHAQNAQNWNESRLQIVAAQAYERARKDYGRGLWLQAKIAQREAYKTQA